MKILIVEDDPILASNLSQLLKQKSYTVELSSDGQEGLFWLMNHEFGAAILDWELPGLSGLEVLRSYRQSGGKIPILILTGRDKVVDKVAGLETGADDYLCKPFDQQEFLARLHALARRSADFVTSKLVVGDIELDSSTCTVLRAGVVVPLGSREYSILELFMRNPGKVFSPSSLIDRLWENDSEVTQAAIRSHVCKIKSKLEQCNGAPVPLKNVYGMGYKLELF